MRRTKLTSVTAVVILVFASGAAEDTGTPQTGEGQPTAASSCCEGRVGDANNSGSDEPTIGDAMDIALLFMARGEAPVCLDEADINQSGGATPTEDDITIGDVSILLDYLFITGPSLGLPDCL